MLVVIGDRAAAILRTRLLTLTVISVTSTFIPLLALDRISSSCSHLPCTSSTWPRTSRTASGACPPLRLFGPDLYALHDHMQQAGPLRRGPWRSSLVGTSIFRELLHRGQRRRDVRARIPPGEAYKVCCSRVTTFKHDARSIQRFGPSSTLGSLPTRAERQDDSCDDMWRPRVGTQGV